MNTISSMKPKWIKICMLSLFFEFLATFLLYVRYYFRTGFEFFNGFDLYGFVYFMLDYHNGFVSRGLTGALMRPILLSVKNVPLTILLCKFFLIAFLVLMFVLIIHRLMCTNRSDVAICIMMLSTRPLYVFHYNYSLRPEYFWYVGIVCMIIVFSLKCMSFDIRMSIITLISVICMLFHHSFIFVFAPCVCAILVAEKSKKWFYTYSIVLCISFLCISYFGQGDYETIKEYVIQGMQFCNMINIYNMPEYRQYLIDDTAFNALYTEFNSSRFTQLFDCPDLTNAYPGHLICMCLFLFVSMASATLSVVIIDKWAKAEHCQNWIRIVFILPFLMLLLFTIDCDRWMLMTLTSINLFSAYLLMGRKTHIPVTNGFGIVFVVNSVFQLLFHMSIYY